MENFGNTEYLTHKNPICSFFFKNFIPPKIVDSDSNNLELSKIVADDKVPGTLAYAHVEPNQRISIPQPMNTVDMKPVFNFSTSFINNPHQGVGDSETTIISSLD